MKEKEFETKFIENGKEIDCFIINAENIEEAQEIAEEIAYQNGVWSHDLEIEVA